MCIWCRFTLLYMCFLFIDNFLYKPETKPHSCLQNGGNNNPMSEVLALCLMLAIFVSFNSNRFPVPFRNFRDVHVWCTGALSFFITHLRWGQLHCVIHMRYNKSAFCNFEKKIKMFFLEIWRSPNTCWLNTNTGSCLPHAAIVLNLEDT